MSDDNQLDLLERPVPEPDEWSVLGARWHDLNEEAQELQRELHYLWRRFVRRQGDPVEFKPNLYTFTVWHQRWAEESLARLMEEQGYWAKEVAVMLGVTYSSVRHQVKKFGLHVPKLTGVPVRMWDEEKGMFTTVILKKGDLK